MMKYIFGIILLAITSAAFAEVYVNETSSGIEYTDTPTSNSRPVSVPPVNSISSPNTPAPSTNTASAPGTQSNIPGSDSGNLPTLPGDQASKGATTYTTFEITSPKPDENIQNQAVISVEFKVVPNLASGDKIQVMLDNSPVGTPNGTTYQELPNVVRGTHTIYAVITNSQNKIVKQSSAITFHVHRNSIITSPASASGGQAYNSIQTYFDTQLESTGTVF